MKKMILLLAFTLLSHYSFADEAQTTGHKMPTQFQAVPMDKAQIVQEGENKMFCPECGMTLPMFYKTNHSAMVNGKNTQYCSIHCLAKIITQEENVTEIKVVDNTTLKFVDASTAWYVVGSDKAGTMSMVSKYAFAQKADAEAFAKSFKGEIKNFDETLALVKKTLAKESTMVAQRQAMMAKNGEALYTKMCQATTASFASVADAKAYLAKEKPCGEINEMQQQAIALYLKLRTK